MTAPIAAMLGFGAGVLAAVIAAAAWAWWASFAAARELSEPVAVDGQIPVLGHALAMWSGLNGSTPGNDAPRSPQPEQKVAHD